MVDSTDNKTPDWIRLSPELEHFDPFEGLVDFSKDQSKNIRYGYRVCGFNLFFDQSIPCEIISKYNIYPIPNTPKWIKGLINHRGNLIPVLDLYRYWSNEKSQEILPLLLFDSDKDYVGLFVDAYPIALEMDNFNKQDSVQTNSIPVELIQFVKSKYIINNNEWYEVDLRSFLHYITRDYSGTELENQAI